MKKGLAYLLCFCITGLSYAASASNQLWDKLLKAQSMKATFHQVIYSKARILSKSTGQMAFERPGHFRWKTNAPTEQLIVADGKKFWLYDIDLEQVTVRPQAPAMSASAGLFLGDDRAKLERDFKVSHIQNKSVDEFKLEAKAKQANIQCMTLIFSGEELRQMEMYDQMGSRTEITFSAIELNPALPAKLFRFTPPKGVDVVGE